MATVNNGILNSYVKKPKNLTEYSAFRGVTDFTQIGQFSQFEGGYSELAVISMPKFLVKAAKLNTEYVAPLVESFKYMLEYEFRGLSGLPDITTENATITNGKQDINMINNVSEDSSVTVSMQFFEKTGIPIVKFCEYYLTGIKDKRSKFKHYHGLIEQGEMDPGYENEVFTLLYYVTDNTGLELERAVLLANAQITGAPLGEILNSEHGQYSNKELSIEFQCFPITGSKVDKAAKALLEQTTGVSVVRTNAGTKRSVTKTNGVMARDSSIYNYSVLNEVYDKVDTSK